MGPFGPPMDGEWNSSGGVLLILGLVALVLLVSVLLVLAGRASTMPDGPDRARSPEDMLRARYVRGELSRQQYLEVLSDLLKDRYIRGEIDVAEYEARLRLLLGEATTRRHDEQERRERT